MFNTQFTIRFLGGADKLPEVTDYNPAETEETLGRLWKHVLMVERDMMTHEAILDQIRAETRQPEAINRASAAPQGGQSRRVKAPTPERYLGEKGDSAFGFIAACNNFRDMEPGAFSNEMTLIRWALQLMGGKADAWRVRQMMRMDKELDEHGDPPEELRSYRHSAEFFLNQFGDPGLVDKARATWRRGPTQTGKAVDYFKMYEGLLIRLNYTRDSQIVLDQV